MLGIGWTEFIFIAIVVLIFVGPEKLPEFVSKISQFIFKLKDASRELRTQLDTEVKEIGKVHSDIKQDIIDKVEDSYRELEIADKKLKDDSNQLTSDIKNEVESTTKKQDKIW